MEFLLLSFQERIFLLALFIGTLILWLLWGHSIGRVPTQATAGPQIIVPASSNSRSNAYRIRGIPLQYEEKQAKQLLKQTLSLDSEYNGLTIRSFAVDATKSTHRVAIVDFQRVPTQLHLSKPFMQWEIGFVVDNDGTTSKDGHLLVDTTFNGITTLATPIKPHRIEIIAMSGLGGHAFGSFKQRGGDFMWLCDSLPLELPEARVSIYGYDTHLHNSHSFQDFEALGGTFRENLQMMSNETEKFIPKIFIGHSLGGLIIKEAMIQMHKLKDPILDVIRGVLFFGVPNQGMEIKSLIPMVQGKPNQLLLLSLGAESQLLRNQCRDFEESLHFRDTEIACFYETAESRTAEQDNLGDWKMAGPYEKLVSSASARHGREWETCSAINKSHSDMVKFDRDDNDYRRVLSKLRQLTEATRLIGYGSRPLGDLEKESLQSLDFPEMEVRQNNVDRPADRTCEWIFNDPIFNSWELGSQNLLWIKGKPGAGKSTLLKHILSSTKGIISARQNNLILSFFFHGRGSPLEKTPFGLYRSLMHQLLQHYPDTCGSFVEEYQKKRNSRGQYGEKWTWQPNEVRDLFEDALNKALEVLSIRIFIDALDECGEAYAQELVGTFERLISNHKLARLRFGICFTCRRYPVLSFDKGAEISVEDQNSYDIKTFLGQDLAQLNFDRVEEVRDTICMNARGVFQWAALVSKTVLQLKRRGRNTEAILREIRKIPRDLEDLYRNLFETLQDSEKDEALRLMRWIRFAMRPMTLDQLRYALVFQSDNPPTSIKMCEEREDFAESSKDMELKLTHLSRGLAETQRIRNKVVVQFIHQSVQDFFETYGLKLLQKNPRFSGDYAVSHAHFMLSQACVHYIALQDPQFIDESLYSTQDDEDDESPYYSDDTSWSEESYSNQGSPSHTSYAAEFLKYSISFWVSHMNLSQNTTLEIPNEYTYLGKIMQTCMEYWTRVYTIMDKVSEDCPLSDTRILHVISRHGLICLLTIDFMVELRDEYDSKNRHGKTPLHRAAERGHGAVVKLLLDTGKVNIDSKDDFGQTPLHRAATEGYEAVIELLLNTGKVNVDSKDNSGRTPLCRAATEGHEAIVKLLLDTGKADIDSKDSTGQTPLSMARERRKKAIADLLRERGADPSL